MIAAALHLWLGCKHSRSLALYFLALGFLVFWVSIRELEEGEVPLLSPRALVRHVEHLQGYAEVLVNGEVLLHLDVADAISERLDDVLVRHLGDLEANIVEALDVLLQGLPWLLLDAS